MHSPPLKQSRKQQYAPSVLTQALVILAEEIDKLKAAHAERFDKPLAKPENQD